MGYTGPGLDFGAFQKIDDISSGFNGGATQFNIQIGGEAAEIASLNQLIISISGVIQEPNSAFTFGNTRSTIAFTGPPAANDTFFGILLGIVSMQAHLPMRVSRMKNLQQSTEYIETCRH